MTDQSVAVSDSEAYAASAARVESDMAVLSSADFTSSTESICRYAFIPEFMRTLQWFNDQLTELGFDVKYDAVGNLVARNVPVGEPAFGIGSHCDSNRNGGPYDGTMGVVVALEVARLNVLEDRGLPLQVMAFAEEESSGFGELLLGSRAAAGQVSVEDLKERFHAVDDGRSFWEHALEAGLRPGEVQDVPKMFDQLQGWIEVHIEQAKKLEGLGLRIGVVDAISGWTHSDYVAVGTADHAGGTPMHERRDSSVVMAEFLLTAERAARGADVPTVATVGSIELSPGIRNVIPGETRWTADIRGVSDACVQDVERQAMDAAAAIASSREVEFRRTHHHVVPAVHLDERMVATIQAVSADKGEETIVMSSGAAHDTMLVAANVPSGMIFVPCRDGISHSPEEYAEAEHAAVAAAIALETIARWMA